jgi:hypothetical protein
MGAVSAIARFEGVVVAAISFLAVGEILKNPPSTPIEHKA